MTKDKKKKISQVPKKPGIYIFKRGDDILYIGKAKGLRARVRSYFNPKVEDTKVKAIVKRADDIEWIVTASEVEALILESTLIKKHKPHYNIDLKDDKRYPYLKITAFEDFPRIEVVRSVERDGGKYFGPYVDAGNMRRVLKIIENIFKVRTCKTVLPAPKGTRPCLNFQIKKCPGLCIGNVHKKVYQDRVKDAVLFLTGKNKTLIKRMQERMKEASEALEFEEASMLRDNINAVKNVQLKQRMRLRDFVDKDVINLAVKKRDCCVAAFLLREGAVTGRHHFIMRLAGGETEPEIYESFIEGYYKKEIFIPKEIVVPMLPAGTRLLEKWLTREADRNVDIFIPQKGDRVRLLELCKQNAELLLDEYLIQKEKQEARIAASVEFLKKDLRLEKLPVKIEAYDVSHTQGKDTAASRVVFENGLPKKSEYRKYNIKTVKKADDYAAMQEVFERRLKRFIKGDEPLPDLFLIDGGKGQLSAVVEVIKRFGLLDIPVVALAKRMEEVFVPVSKSPLMIPKTSPALKLLQQLRDEAHRFALGHHRKKREERTLKSGLDDIKGIGEKRRTMLLKKFGSFEKIKKLSLNDLVKAGVSEKIAKEILKH
jgi:excinuclease ABC subunit C